MNKRQLRSNTKRINEDNGGDPSAVSSGNITQDAKDDAGTFSFIILLILFHAYFLTRG